MEEIKKKIDSISLIARISLMGSVISLLVSAKLLIMTDNATNSIRDDIKTVNFNVRGLDEGLRMNRSTEMNIEKLLDDYKKLKSENEILRNKINSYKK